MHRASRHTAAPSARRRGAPGIVQRRAGRSHGCECRGRPGAPRDAGARPDRPGVVALVSVVSPAAVVTGSARGIGAATVDALVAAGWQVVAVDRSADDPALDYALATKADLEEVAGRHGDAVRAVVGDVRSPSDMRSAVDEAIRHFGGVQAAVAAAGVISGGPPLWETADAQWDAQFEVNVNGGRRHLAVICSRAGPAARRRRRRPGAIVWSPMASAAEGCSGCRAAGAYNVEARRDRIDALPGCRPGRHGHHRQCGVPRLHPRPDARCVGRRLRTWRRPRGVRQPPIASSGSSSPAEPAALIAWLCGPDSGGVTGAALPVDGGMTTS